MGKGQRSRLSLNSLLAAVEAAPPVAAVDVLAAALAEAIGAREVSFLIADFSGRSLIRLGHSVAKGTLGSQAPHRTGSASLSACFEGQAARLRRSVGGAPRLFLRSARGRGRSGSARWLRQAVAHPVGR